MVKFITNVSMLEMLEAEYGSNPLQSLPIRGRSLKGILLSLLEDVDSFPCQSMDSKVFRHIPSVD